jgi:DNA-binding beta-propeller fold protein YncE
MRFRMAGGRWAKWATLAALTLVLSACAGQAHLDPVFWPASPDLPRVQFLRGIKDSADVFGAQALNLFKMGEKGKEQIDIVKPYGIAVRNGKIYLTDTVPAEVLIIDLQAKTMSRLAGNAANGKLKKPIGIAVNEDGTVYVADTSRLEVLEYSPQGAYLRSFGKELNIRPADVQSEGDYLYILDAAQSRLLILDRTSGEVLRSVGQGGADYARLSVPLALASDGKGALFITNFNGHVVAYDRDGHFLKGFGHLGQGLADFGRPRGIATDGDGLVYIVDTAAQNTRIYDDKFRILMDFGGPGNRASLNVPAGVAVSRDNLEFYQALAQPDFQLEKVIFVVSQFGDNKISIFGMGKKKGVDYDAEYRKIGAELIKKERELKERKDKGEQEKNAPASASPVPTASASPVPAASASQAPPAR